MSSNNSKETPPAELSLKFMAWNVKEISENLKRISGLFEEHIQLEKKKLERVEANRNALLASADKDEILPF